MLIFLDLETTGLEESDRICSIGLIALQEGQEAHVIYELVNEGKKIPPKASSVHHITNEMLANKTSFTQSESYKFLELHNNANTTIVGHNVNFDMQMLSGAGFHFKGKLIDTLRVTRHLIPESEFFSLQFLRYELKLYRQEKDLLKEFGVDGVVHAHHALGDAVVVKLLYDSLCTLAPSEEFYSLSNKYVLLQKLDFGKYAGRYIEEIMLQDRAYLEWMLNTIENLDEDLRYSIEYYF